MQRIQQGTSKLVRSLKRCFLDPLKIILYLRYPAVAITVYYASITFGCLYILNISVETTFSKPPYNFTIIEVGLAYIPGSVGYLAASLFGGRWTDKIMAREARKARRYDEKGKLVYAPADRMRENAWIAAFLYPSALIWYGWTAEKGIQWAVPVRLKTPFHIYSHSVRCPIHPLALIIDTQYHLRRTLADNTCTIANRQLLLRRWQHADLRRCYNHAHGVHAAQSLIRCCGQ